MAASRRTSLQALARVVTIIAAVAASASIASTSADASPQPRVFGGSAVAQSTFNTRWPFIVGVLVDGGSAASCGGSMVGRATVVTAMHCVLSGDRMTGAPYAPSRFTVVSGNTVLAKGFRLAVHKVVLNPNWNPTALTGDIAVLQLSEPAINARTIVPLKATDPAPVGAGARVAGWGATGTSSGSPTLLETQLQIGDDALCSDPNPPGIGSVFNATEQLCAGDPVDHSDSCTGDSGGPLTWVDAAGKTRLAGVVSFGIADGCNAGDVYAVYTRVAQNQAFIDSNIHSPFEKNPTTPQNVKLAYTGPGAITITWGPSAGLAKIVNFDVLRKTGSTWRRLTRTTGRRFVVHNVTNGRYQFAVLARDAKGRTSLRGLAPALNISLG